MTYHRRLLATPRLHLTLFLPAMSTTTSLLTSLLTSLRMFFRLLMTAGGTELSEVSSEVWKVVVNW